MIKKFFLGLFFLTILVVLLILKIVLKSEKAERIISPISSADSFLPEGKPLLKYSFSFLSQKEFFGSKIKLEKILKDDQKFTSWLFSFQTEGKKVTGLANLPKKEGKLPVIVMIRGYVDVWAYKTGTGTRKPAEFFAQNGFITLAPDFLGYGSSDPEEKDILLNRFQRPVTVLDLLASIKTLPQADPENIFLWGHSNGGQIALSVLEISGRPIPTTLWAPVTRGFPESVLNYSAQLDDNGKIVAERIEEFKKNYDPKEYSITEYFDKINAPIQVHLGTYDEYIRQEWIEEFVAKLKSLNKEINYYIYPKNNHQLGRDWETVVKRDLEFFGKNSK